MAGPQNTGGTAFPMQDPVAIHAYATARIAHMGGEPDEERERAYVAARAEAVGGMTLRDYFAAKAMHMVFEKAIHNWKQDGEEDLKIDFEFVAESAYLMADAMLKAKEIA